MFLFENPKKVDLDLKNRETPPTKPLIEEPPKLELKSLPSHLQYVFLSSGEMLAVICVADLLDHQVVALVSILREIIKAIG